MTGKGSCHSDEGRIPLVLTRLQEETPPSSELQDKGVGNWQYAMGNLQWAIGDRQLNQITSFELIAVKETPPASE